MDSDSEYSDFGSGEESFEDDPATSAQKYNESSKNDDEGISFVEECNAVLSHFRSYEHDPNNIQLFINPYLLQKYEFENPRKTSRPGPKSKTRDILTLGEMFFQLEDNGINHETAKFIGRPSFVDSIYIHPDLLKNFNFNTKTTSRPGPKSKTEKTLTMREMYDQIVEAGINPENGHYL